MYIIFYMQNIKNGVKTQVLALYGNPTLSVWESQPLGGHLPWTLDTLWNCALGLLPQQNVPNLSPGRFIQLDKTYQKEFENICNLYGLGSENVIDMTKKGKALFSDSERPREGSSQPGVPCTDALRAGAGVQQAI